MDRTDDLRELLGGADRVDPVARDELLRDVERGLFGPRAPLVVGRYEILHPLGGGGQGVVYVAHDPRLDRRVAVKLLRVESTGVDAHRRLLREAAALARLSHPNVVGVNDVGHCDAGVYIVTELVAGQTLEAWLCAGRPWREVLRAFLEAAEGLAAAHARGIVHRDFKPANVLVGDDGRVRLLDFGLARHTGRDEPSEHDPSLALGSGGSLTSTRSRRIAAPTWSSGAATLTRSGDAMGTPAYMAPEQHAGIVADEAADQFAFCVALYEGLWGHRPYEGRTVEELSAAKRWAPVPRPPRGHDAPRALFGVVARGLRADPRARWPRMEDLCRALRGAAAHPRRRRRLAVAGGIVVALGVIGVSLAVPAAARSERETVNAAQAPDEDTAAVRRAIAEGRELVVEGRFADAIPVVDDAMQAAERSGDPSLQADAALAQGRLLYFLGRYDEGARALEAGYLRADAAGLDALALPCARELAMLHGGAKADAVAGREWLRRAEVARERLGAEVDPAESGLLLLAAAEVEGRAGNQEEGLRLGRDAVRVLAQELPDADSRLVRARTAVARTLMFMNRLDEAKEQADRAMQEALRSCGPDHVHTASVLNVLALIAKRRGDFPTSLELQRRNLAIRERAVGPSDPIVAGVLGNIAVLLSELGRPAEAEETYRRALAIQKETVGSDDPVIARTLHNLAITVKDRGRVEEALELWREALSIGTRTLGPDHPEVAAYEFMYATTLGIAGRHDEALPLFRHALEVDRAALGEDHPIVAERLAGLGDALLHLGKPDEARRHIEASVAIAEAAYGREHVHTARMRAVLAKVLAAEGRIAESLKVHQECLAVLEAGLGSEHTALAELLVAIAEQHAALGHPREAREARARAEAIFAAAR